MPAFLVNLYNVLVLRTKLVPIGNMMKKYGLKHEFKGCKKGSTFYVMAESEFIGVKEVVLRTEDLKRRIVIKEEELNKNFVFQR